MKRTTYTPVFVLIIILSIHCIIITALVPQKVSYHAVIRNAGGELVKSGTVGVKASILQGSASGTVT